MTHVNDPSVELGRRVDALLRGLDFSVVWEADAASLRFTFVSERAKKVTGFTAAEWAQEEGFWAQHVPAEDMTKLLAMFRNASAAGDSGERFEHRFVRADGQLIWLHTGVVFDRREDGRHVLNGVSTDVTSLKAAEEAARRALAARDQLLEIVSHDLRTPLSVILMASEQALKLAPPGGLGDRLRQLAASSVRAATQLIRLIGDLVDSSSVETGALSVERRPQGPETLLKDVTEAMLPLASEHGVELKRSVSDPSATVLCDRERILQVFTNLVGNALKFTARGGSVMLHAEPRGEREVMFTVRDDGRGMQPDEVERMFEHGWRADPRSGGLGVGLFIARGIVEAHEGRIWAESRPGQGTAVHFTLPRVPPTGPGGPVVARADGTTSAP